MRFQTSLEKFSQVTNGQIFAVSLVGLRIFCGIFCLLSAATVLSASNSNPDVAAVVKIAVPVLIVIGASFCLGIGVRLAATLAILWVIFGIVTNLPGSTIDETLTNNLVTNIGAILFLGLFTAGGSGHIFGLDGLIYRNLRRHNALTKFIFG